MHQGRATGDGTRTPAGFRPERSDEALLAILGERLAAERLRRDCSQADLAEQAGVSRATVQRLEAGASTQLTNLLRILRALDLVDRLEAVVPPIGIRPLDELERRGRERRRASRRGDRPDGDKPDREASWSWGEDA